MVYYGILRKLLGFLCFCTTFVTFIVLVTYDIFNSSLTNISSQQCVTNNILGKFGANIIDLIMQSIGYSSILPLLFLIIIGIKLFNNTRQKYLLLRSVVLLYTIAILAYLLSFLECGYLSCGGFLGNYIRHFIPDHSYEFYFNSSMSLALLILIYASFGLSLAEWQKVFKSPYQLVNFFRVYKKRKRDKYLSAKKTPGNVLPTASPLLKRRIKKKFLPSIDLLYQTPQGDENIRVQKVNYKEEIDKLTKVLEDYGVYGDITDYSMGPIITLYEFKPQAGTKSSRVISLADDISRSMCAKSTRIALIPGKNVLGIEIPNKERALVCLRALMATPEYKSTSAFLPVILGQYISGGAAVEDLTKMPHLLVAGTTGSGKSVGINALILSLLYARTPEECRFIMIDPKMLELSVYNGIPHLLSPVVTEPQKAVGALKWVVKEMERRYQLMSTAGVRNIKSYNECNLPSHETYKDTETKSNKKLEAVEKGRKKLPHIVVIVDEMADLMLVAGKEIEIYIQRISQMARASGIHLVMATQRPSVDVITGVIKANFPSRISFYVTSKIDSRTILGEQGAEQLLGMGDMLCTITGRAIKRVHGPFVSDAEIEKVVQQLKLNSEVDYKIDLNCVQKEEVVTEENTSNSLYQEAVQVVLRDNRTSISHLQRRLKIGYNRAVSFLERMERESIISPPNSQGKREII